MSEKKITTADCVAAIKLEERLELSKELLGLRPRWKRIRKAGKRGDGIIRVFSSKQTPWIKAIVQEHHGGQLSVRFAQRQTWEIGPDEEVDYDEMDEWLAKDEMRVLTGPEPGDFRFGISCDDPADKEIYVYLEPRYDRHRECEFGPELITILPRGTRGQWASVVSESTYHIELDGEDQVRDAMVRLGFVHDPAIDGILGC
jgi:hypothetical protein